MNAITVQDRHCLIFDDAGKLIDTGKLKPRTATQCTLKRSRFGSRFNVVIKSGKVVGKNWTVKEATPEQYAEAEGKIERKRIAEQFAEEEKRRAEYDALPEEIKLARKIGFFVDCSNHDVLAKLVPIDSLRSFWSYLDGKQE